ncbi:hypothetical protein SAMN06265379_1222 [Saccharicrinis carchari]|uniref:Uncharacterized protein n=1 Tax=Saccharicrinis carchari TaxID=1168039 RepID=A0A521FD16_SACCC|nr:hypothetical protein SAMN06265379_1222 [Saccharicrinis carchari]
MMNSTIGMTNTGFTPSCLKQTGNPPFGRKRKSPSNSTNIESHKNPRLGQSEVPLPVFPKWGRAWKTIALSYGVEGEIGGVDLQLISTPNLLQCCCATFSRGGGADLQRRIFTYPANTTRKEFRAI